MLTVHGIFDGNKIDALESIPFKVKKKVMIIFLDDVPDETTSVDIDPIAALRGCSAKADLTSKLLQSRQKDMEMEKAKWKNER